jgi:hypothetical protein
MFACLVQTINETDPSFQERFSAKLEEGYREFKDHTEGDVTQELELFSWTREYLTGWNMITGQGKPFLGSSRLDSACCCLPRTWPRS